MNNCDQSFVAGRTLVLYSSVLYKNHELWPCDSVPDPEHGNSEHALAVQAVLYNPNRAANLGTTSSVVLHKDL